MFNWLFRGAAVDDASNAMQDFVRERGGCVRFDTFAREHLLGPEKGFYSKSIDLSSNHDPVHTPMAAVPEYRQAYARFVLREASKLCNELGRSEIRILEIGPGGGELCRQLHSELQADPGVYTPLQTIHYVGVDPNADHAAAVMQAGGFGIKATAQRLPFGECSLDMVVAEEVLDTLPYRVFQTNKRSVLVKEGYVVATKKGLQLEFYDLDRGGSTEENLKVVNDFLQRLSFRGSYYVFSEDYSVFWREIHRVLQPHGVALVSDYTTDAWLAAQTVPGMEQEAVAHPYRDDLTHLVDRKLQLELAGQAGFPSVEAVEAQMIFTQLGGPRAAEEIVRGARMLLRVGANSDKTANDRG